MDVRMMRIEATPSNWSVVHYLGPGQPRLLVDRVGLGPSLDPGVAGSQRPNELDAQLRRQRGSPAGHGGHDSGAAAGVR